jgi:hypothetical protein
MLHLDADFASEFGLKPGVEVALRAYEMNGDVEFRIEETPTGVTPEQLREYAERNDWIQQTDRSIPSGGRRLVYLDPDECVRISMRSPGHLDGVPMNNITVESEPVSLTDEPRDRYQQLLAIAQQKGLSVQVDDSTGLWQRLKTSNDHDTDKVPDPETITQLADKADSVTVQFVWTARSTGTDAEMVGDVVVDIRAALDKQSDDGCDPDDEEISVAADD